MKSERLINPVEDPEFYFDMSVNFDMFLKLLKQILENEPGKLQIIEILGTSAAGKTSFVNMVVKCLFYDECPSSWSVGSEGISNDAEKIKNDLKTQVRIGNHIYSWVSFFPLPPSNNIAQLVLNNMYGYKGKNINFEKEKADNMVIHIFFDEFDRIYLAGIQGDIDSLENYLESLDNGLRKLINFLDSQNGRIHKILIYIMSSYPIFFENYRKQVIENKYELIESMYELSEVESESSPDTEKNLMKELKGKFPVFYYKLPIFIDIPVKMFHLSTSRERITSESVRQFLEKIFSSLNVEEQLKSDFWNCLGKILDQRLINENEQVSVPFYYYRVLIYILNRTPDYKKYCENPDNLIDLIKSYRRYHWDDLTLQHGLVDDGYCFEGYNEFEKLLDKGDGIEIEENDISLMYLLQLNNVAYESHENGKRKIFHIWTKNIKNLSKLIKEKVMKRRKLTYLSPTTLKLPFIFNPILFNLIIFGLFIEVFLSFFVQMKTVINVTSFSFPVLILLLQYFNMLSKRSYMMHLYLSKFYFYNCLKYLVTLLILFGASFIFKSTLINILIIMMAITFAFLLAGIFSKSLYIHFHKGKKGVI